MLSEGSRGWLWTAVLLLAAVSTCLAQSNPDVNNNSAPATSPTTPSPVTTNATQTPTTTQTSTPANVTVGPSSKPTSPSPSPKTSTTAPASPSSTTKGSTPASTTSSATVTTNATDKPTTGSSTTTSTATSTISSGPQKVSGFDLGSFIGGIVLTLVILAAAYFGCRFYNSRRGVRYRTIDEHEAII
ncbi:porimin [Pyxicephalus adspersus]|uniref:Porimin n=1 Tax=Pyxicephalus adspersus TaxID=30357 RepID=A0AAV3AM35_PYXAD|nr:TPA: hypothetical protein GDO54_000289 [Pyxicephalus adspersus]